MLTSRRAEAQSGRDGDMHRRGGTTFCPRKGRKGTEKIIDCNSAPNASAGNSRSSMMDRNSRAVQNESKAESVRTRAASLNLPRLPRARCWMTRRTYRCWGHYLSAAASSWLRSFHDLL